MIGHVLNSGGIGRGPALFVALSACFLLLAVAGVVWRVGTPSDGTTVNEADTAVSMRGVLVKDLITPEPLKIGDLVVAIDGRNVVDRISTGVGGPPVHAGQALTYDIVRDGVPMSVDVTLRQLPLDGALLNAWPSILVLLGLLLTAVTIFATRPEDRASHAALLASSIGIATVAWGAVFHLQAVDLVLGSQFWRWFAGQLMFSLVWGGMLHFATAFPEVAKPHRYRVHVLAGYAGGLLLYPVVAVPALFLQHDPVSRFALVASPTLGTLAVYPPLIIGVLWWKYRHQSDPLQQRRLRWLATSLGGGGLLYLAVWIVPAALTGEPLVPMNYHTLSFLPVPLAVAYAIVRHQALNIEVVISRSLVIGALSVALAGLYAAVVSLLSLLFGGNAVWEQATGATLIALVAHPLYARLRRAINKRLFGAGTDPYRLVSTLASQLESVPTPAEQLDTMVETIGTALRLTYVAIELDRDAGREKAASFGTPTSASHRLPLTYQGEQVGLLVIARRGPREVLGRKELSVLTAVARHAGTVAYTARLTTDLVRSRDRLVRAREEERRWLLRELHDGVGPTLAAVTLGLHASRRTLDDSTPAGVLLDRMQDALAGAITEIRRLARDLRPPALDNLGLLGAVREFLLSVDGEELAVGLHAPETLPPLPPAVDVAAYRIVCEAVTNVTRHAKASRCTVHFRVEDCGLVIEIADDGIGLVECPGQGLGLGSMRERADELGGELRITTPDGGGTRIRAVLPVPKEAK
jgi:two-component system NarL family sensor kinase